MNGYEGETKESACNKSPEAHSLTLVLSKTDMWGALVMLDSFYIAVAVFLSGLPLYMGMR